MRSSSIRYLNTMSYIGLATFMLQMLVNDVRVQRYGFSLNFPNFDMVLFQEGFGAVSVWRLQTRCLEAANGMFGGCKRDEFTLNTSSINHVK